MAEESGRTFEVIITIERTCTVFVPDEVLINRHETHEDAAEEIAMGGKMSWPKFCLDQDETREVESITEISGARTTDDGGER